MGCDDLLVNALALNIKNSIGKLTYLVYLFFNSIFKLLIYGINYMNL